MNGDPSQGGEGMFLLKRLRRKPDKTPLLVEVGTYGAEFSNTIGLLKAGWYGLLIEANPERVPIIHREFSGLNYRLLNIAVGKENASAQLHLHQRIGSSSLLTSWEPDGVTGNTVTVQMRKFSEVLREHHVPQDFEMLFVDAEGMDKEIVSDALEAGYRPLGILVEVMSFGQDTQCALFFRQWGYKLVQRFEPGNPWGNMYFELGG